ncbi:MAG: hypothetical protein CVT67_04990 [Actinobacteria bacterium HGW-Actinobacteria-7]|jgi:hypothetical protein|nr:MAG: hypothetical protein CVT67_04990 [Actinobacteria bacterium HGW-Actinobacteria-7]
MSENARFCSKCGEGLIDDARFCAKCGEPRAVVSAATAPVPPQPAVPAPPPVVPAPAAYVAPVPAAVAAPVYAAMPQDGASEQVRAVIPNVTLKAGFMGVKTRQYTLVLTDNRILFAQITMAMMKQLVADARDGAKSEGKGFFGQWGAQLTAYSDFAGRYLEMSPEQVLSEAADNFAIERSTITKTSTKTRAASDDSGMSTEHLVIKTTQKKYDMTLGSGISQARQALAAVGMI